MEYLVDKFMNITLKNKQMDDLTRKKVKYGIEVLIINISKFIITLIVAKLLGIVVETLEIILIASLIRQYAFGAHAGTSFQCTIVTLIMYIVPVILSKHIFFNYYIYGVLFAISVGLLYKYAPSDTEKRPLVSEKKRKMLKKKTLIMVGVLGIVALITNIYSLKVAIFLGVFVASLLTTPLVYKILGQKYKNYERC
ncbi:MAG: accessory gene regulator B family protein [Clostridiaceae bacterium]